MTVPETVSARDLLAGAGIDFAALVEDAPIGMAVLDRDLRYLLCNRQLAELNGAPQEGHIGRTFAEMVSHHAPTLEEPFRGVLLGQSHGDAWRISSITQGSDRLERIWTVRASPLQASDGQIRAIVVTVQDVTEVDDARTALAERERILRASHQLSRDSFSILRAIRAADGSVTDLECEFANPAALASLGFPDLIGRRFLDVLPGGRKHPDLFPRYVRLLDTQGGDEVELHYDADDVIGWFRNSAVAIDADRVAVSFRNITARYRTEQQLRLVSQELKHRNRNLLTVVGGLMALAEHSARDVQGLVEGVQKQLQALAASQDLLTSTIDEQAPLRAAIRAALEPFEELNITVTDGPEVLLAPRAVVPLIMALSEMATNAVKYGALSTAGEVRIAWHIHGGEVTLEWVEQGGPPVHKPKRRGLGSRLLDAAGTSLRNGRVEQDFDRAGLKVRFVFEANGPADDGAAAG
jgi:PAS domain S-box-containing protein